MNTNISVLEQKINDLRQELDDLIQQKNVRYDVVLDISRRLDDLIVFYVSTKNINTE
jgi:hypothetical protein